MSDNLGDLLGPVEYLALEFPDGNVDPSGFHHLQEQAASGSIYLIDLEFVRRTDSGALETVGGGSLSPDLAEFEGSFSGLLDRDDLELVGADLAPGGVLAVIIYESLTLNAALSAWEAAGARLVAEGPVSSEDLELALGDEPTGQEA